MASRTCVLVRGGSYDGKQGGTFTAGISVETAGAQRLCMHVLTLPPGTRAQAHVHAGHESAVVIVSGRVNVWHGPDLSHHLVMEPGDCLYIPADVEHLPVNLGEEPMIAVVARTDPHEQESVHIVALPDHLDGIGSLPIAAPV